MGFVWEREQKGATATANKQGRDRWCFVGVCCWFYLHPLDESELLSWNLCKPSKNYTKCSVWFRAYRTHPSILLFALPLVVPFYCFVARDRGKHTRTQISCASHSTDADFSIVFFCAAFQNHTVISFSIHSVDLRTHSLSTLYVDLPAQ